MKMHRLVNLRFVIAASIKMVKASLHGWNGYAWSSNQFRLLSELTRKLTNLLPTYRNAFVNYMEFITKMVEHKIKEKLPLSFPLLLDCWSSSSANCVRIYDVD